ncbi:ATP-binding cassette domain-containing protein [Candidatus Persebacteraceae bacterium Df01]|jgi:lipooligosaccharide transport system ATP-binding protein|uniref:ATP-binding cassette domain-containing protein n=1 Tax=Candidatus Doriopsillibacter californiensis TaxID=2970740 RepID=A0ABT7QK64_9GAMM|nr:ATP-binding cassette domain-containing protein [Candidatus Persebacteraceae bacterium Df01]
MTASVVAKPAMRVDQVCKYFGNRIAVDGVSFTAAAGECLGILGPNGAGKSTLLRICLGVCEQDAGTVQLLDYDIPVQALAARRRIGVVPQKDTLDPDFSCAENLAVYMSYFGLPRNDRVIDELMNFAGLSSRETAPITQLSGGMQRRLTLARALVNNPDVIFLDEPTTGLDPQARHLIWERLRQLRAAGKTLLLTTHFMEEAERLCDRLIVMDEGKIIAAGTPDTLIRENVESEVVEVYGDTAHDWLDEHADITGRREDFGYLSYCYVDEAAPLIDSLRAVSLRFSHRQANMEDVFLRLTGRALRE